MELIMKTIAVALIASLILATGAFAQEAQAWRKVAEAIPLGTKVSVQTLDGRRVKGTLMRVDDTTVHVKKHTRIPEAPAIVAFDQIGNIERENGGGMGWGKAIGLGVGAGAAAILTIMAIAFQLD
jgi:hypothetical protein